MQNLRSIKGFIVSLALGIASYASIAVVTATTPTNINSAHASSFEKDLKKMHKRTHERYKRQMERQARTLARDAHKAAVFGTIGIASGGILMTQSDRRKMRKIQQQQAQNYQNYRGNYPSYQQPQYANPYQQYYLQ